LVRLHVRGGDQRGHRRIHRGSSAAVHQRPMPALARVAGWHGNRGGCMSDDTTGRTIALRSYALSTLTVVVILVAWEVVARAKLVPDLFLPSVSAVLLAFRNGIADNSLPTDLWISLY